MTPTKLIPTSVVCMSSTDNEYPYVDVCFNPFYQRQVAVIDRAGNWKILENEPRHGRERLPTIVPAKSGNIFDSWDAEANSQIPQYNFDDGWNQIFWVCDLSTIVVCNRTHLAVFDTKSSPVRLDSSELMISKGLDLILDVKRSAESVSDVFVLTTSRIYWIKIVPLSVGDHGSEGQSGLHVVLSYRHFRSENDLDMRLTVLQDQFGELFESFSVVRLTRTYDSNTFSLCLHPLKIHITSQLLLLPCQRGHHSSTICTKFISTI